MLFPSDHSASAKRLRRYFSEKALEFRRLSLRISEIPAASRPIDLLHGLWPRTLQARARDWWERCRLKRSQLSAGFLHFEGLQCKCQDMSRN